MKRVGRRGEGRFERISWDEALETTAHEIRRVKETYGNGALFVPYGTGSYSNTNGSHLARRLSSSKTALARNSLRGAMVWSMWVYNRSGARYVYIRRHLAGAS